MHVAKVIRANAPDVWKAIGAMCSKDRMHALLATGEPVFQIGWNGWRGEPTVRILVPVALDSTNSNEWHCVDLSADVDRLLMKDVASLHKAMKSYKGIRSVKVNAMPLILPMDHPAAANLAADWDLASVGKIKSADGFADRVSDSFISASTCVFSICSRTVSSAAARFTASSGRSVRSDRQRNWFGTWFDSLFGRRFRK